MNGFNRPRRVFVTGIAFAGAAGGSSPLFAGRQVPVKAWCIAWVKKA